MRILIGNLLSGVLYFLAGILFSDIARDAGYASLIWPSAGVALAAMVAFGWRVIPGLWTGILLLNLHLSGSIPVALTVAFGAVIQAWVGSRLVADLFAREQPLVRPGDILKFFLLAGLLSPIVNPTISSMGLVIAGVIPFSGFWSTWINWWMGDAFGIFIFAPIFLLLMGKMTGSLSRICMFALVPLLGLPVLVGIFTQGLRFEERAISLEFEQKAMTLANHLEVEFARYAEQVESLAGLFRSSVEVDPDEFRIFTGPVLERFASIQAMEWAPLVKDKDREAFEARMSQRLQKDTSITEQDADGHVIPAGERTYYLPIEYAEPPAGNSPALAFDLGSEPARAEAAQRAVEGGVVAATPALPLVQLSKSQLGFLLMAPVFKQGALPPRGAEGFDSLRGLVLAVYRLEPILARIVPGGLASDHTWVEVLDQQGALVGRYPHTLADETSRESVIQLTSTINLGDRKWILRFGATHQYLARRFSTLLVVMFNTGLVLIMVIGLLVLLMTGTQEAVKQLVIERTRELVQAKEQAEDNIRIKDEFLSVVSHELRTPLTAILGSLGLFGGKGLEPAQQAGVIDIARRNAEKLLMLINDLLDVQRLEAGQVDLKVESVPLRSLFDTAMRDNRPYADRYNVNLKLSEPVPSVKVKADVFRVQQVLANLVSNAVKHSRPRGRVDLAADLTGSMVRISVVDHGEGVPTEFRPRLFTRFSQADSSVGRKHAGTGLGLTIARSLVELHGGSIGYLETPGGGATFFFTLPVDET